jgi:cell division protein ZapA
MKQNLTLSILNKEWILKCPSAEKDRLLEAALYLDHLMKTLKAEERAVTYEQFAVLAALSLSHELVIEKSKTKKMTDVDKRIAKLRTKLFEKLTVLEN